MFEKINFCIICKKEFKENEVAMRWITSNILKFDFTDVLKFKYVYPLHYFCIDEMKKELNLSHELTDADFEAGNYNFLLENTKKHIEFANV